ncbi:MAG: HAMP domain-containing histidine kinase, partial [Rivularia sp. ALOHA_DT_140]|nr:HAMP domain-containing histidine kinase [Rivularia sp. ALOHA_DT_140]
RSLLRLNHSIDERDEIARQREDFVSRLTHDLRTPLVAEERMMILFLEGALGELSPSMKEALTIMARSNSNLLAMVNTLLEVYRFEAGRKTLAFLTVDICQLIEEVASELTPLAEQKGLLIQVDLKQSENGISVLGDRLELHRLITNLVGNAIKFTDNGSVSICLESDSTDCDVITIKIVDTGQGISAEQQATLFERFRPGSNKSSGSGLGLYLSRRIVEAHQGNIKVDSELGKGSVFTVVLPIKQSVN